MNRRQRQRFLLETVTEVEELDFTEATRLTGASEPTIRRDFQQLAEEGHVNRFWGGIRRKKASIVNTLESGPPAFAARQEKNIKAKKVIAAQAATLIKKGDVLMIDGGTTTLHLCPHIAHLEIQVITNSLIIALNIERLRKGKGGAEVLLCGGRLQPDSWVVSGPAADAFLRRYRADWVFLSAAGVNANKVMNYDEAVLSSERLMLRRATSKALLVDPSKFQTDAMCDICPTSSLDIIISTKKVSAEAIQSIKSIPKAPKVLLAD